MQGVFAEQLLLLGHLLYDSRHLLYVDVLQLALLHLGGRVVLHKLLELRRNAVQSICNMPVAVALVERVVLGELRLLLGRLLVLVDGLVFHNVVGDVEQVVDHRLVLEVPEHGG